MTAGKLGKKLADMYYNAEKNEKVTMIHLFGIQFSEQIREAGVKEVIGEAGIPSSFRAELNKGMRLAKHVTPLQLNKI